MTDPNALMSVRLMLSIAAAAVRAGTSQRGHGGSGATADPTVTQLIAEIWRGFGWNASPGGNATHPYGGVGLEGEM